MVDMQTIMDEMNRTKQLLNQKKQENNKKSQTTADEPTDSPELELPEVTADESTKDGDSKLPDLNEGQEETEEETTQITQQRVLKTQAANSKSKNFKSTNLKSLTSNPLPKLKTATNDPQLLSAVQELNTNITELLQLLKTTAEEMRKEDPIAAKLDQVADQNDKIAQALLTVADMIKEIQNQTSISNAPPTLRSEVPNNPNMPTFKEPSYSFKPKFVAADSGQELELPAPPPDDYAANTRLQPLPEMRTSRTSGSQQALQQTPSVDAPEREQLKPLECNKAPLSYSDMKKRGLFR